MNKGKKGRKLHRTKGQREHLVRALANSLFLHFQITSSKAKLKHAQPTIEKMISRAKRNSLDDRRYLDGQITKEAAKNLVNIIAPKMKEREGGYTRVIGIGHKTISAIPKAVMQLTDMPATPEKQTKKKEAKKQHLLKSYS